MSNFRIHPDTVEAVKQRLDIYDIIAEHIVLKKRGKNFVGLCPFHDEKTPSFTVSPAKQMYYCFGCGNGGNGIKFLMELGKESFSQVVLGLAKRYQIQVKTESAEQTQEIQQQISRR
ncbi:MAG: CHC2 zinc finger domain-containing protein, partial [Microcoleaceae cyanobacterium]